MITKYYLYYTTDGNMSLTAICRQLSVSIFDVLRINGDVEGLVDFQINGGLIPKGTVLKIPYKNTGSIESNAETYEIVQDKYNSIGFVGLNTGPSVVGQLGGSSTEIYNKMKSAGSVLKSSDFNCTVCILHNGVPGEVWSLPVYPQEFSDNNSASFSSQSILGRSVDYQIYQGSSRSVSFTLNLHNELCSDYSYVYNLVAYIESACYPNYSSGVVKVPEIAFTIGKQFKIRGILESCSSAWKSPVIDGKHVNCDLSVSVRETTGPWSSSQVKSKGGYRW